MTTKTHALQDFKHRTQKLLESKTLRSLCVSGEWGIGKTFAWNKLLKELRNAPAAHEVKYYAYVSLFGLSTIEQVSAAIIQESENYSLQEYTVHEQVLNWLPAFAGLAWRFAKGILRSVLNLPFVLRKRSPQYFWGLAKHDSVLNAFKAVGNELMPWMPEKALICFDDLERKNESLSTDQIFGLISHLQENLGCKIVFIFNDEKLNTNDAKQFHQSYEKVFDTQFKFQPDFTECIDIAVPGNDPISDEVKICANALKIKNIRVLKRITPLCVEASMALGKVHPSIQERAIKIVVLLEWARRTGNEAHAFAIRRYIWEGLPLSEFSPSKTSGVAFEQVDEWIELVKQYDLQGHYDFDKEVVRGVEDGYFLSEKLKVSSSVVERIFKYDRERKIFSRGWAPYRDSLSENEDVVVDSLEKAIQGSITSLGVGDLDGVVRLFVDLGMGQRAKQLIGEYVDANFGESGLFAVAVGVWNDIEKVHPLLIAAADADNPIEMTPNFPNLISSILQSKEWAPEEMEVWDAISDADLEGFLRHVRSEKLLSKLNEFLQHTKTQHNSHMLLQEKF